MSGRPPKKALDKAMIANIGAAARSSHAAEPGRA
jgi:hypothetical protein